MLSRQERHERRRVKSVMSFKSAGALRRALRHERRRDNSADTPGVSARPEWRRVKSFVASRAPPRQDLSPCQRRRVKSFAASRTFPRHGLSRAKSFAVPAPPRQEVRRVWSSGASKVPPRPGLKFTAPYNAAEFETHQTLQGAAGCGS